MKKSLKGDMQVSRLEDSAGPWHVDAQPAPIERHMREAYFMKKALECLEPRFHDLSEDFLGVVSCVYHMGQFIV